jgi:hypothetical protein
MKAKLIVPALSLGLALVSSQASARTFHYPASECVPVSGSAACVDYGQWGVGSICSTAVTVECALPITYIDNTQNVSQVTYFGYDRNSTSGANLTCTLQKRDSDGTVMNSWTLGMSTPTSAAAGVLTKNFPAPNVLQNRFWSMRCTIPGVQAGQFSHLTNFLLVSNDSN